MTENPTTTGPGPQPGAGPETLTITAAELHDPKVDEKLRQHQMVSLTRQHYETAAVPTAPAKEPRFKWLYNAVVYMSLFGTLGGLVGYAFGEALHFRPNPRRQFDEYVALKQSILAEVEIGKTTRHDAEAATREFGRPLAAVGGNAANPYYAIDSDDALAPAQRDAKIKSLDDANYWRNLAADVLFYGVCGMTIAVALAAAESVVERNWRGAAVYASAGAVAGLAGGVVVALVVGRAAALVSGGGASAARKLLAVAVGWVLLGVFLGAAPGLVLRNGKKLRVGVLGGLAGGLVGGLLFGPLAALTDSEHLSRLIGVIAIGGVAGAAMGLLENVVKSGWFKVVAGVIAGKQFVLYRNPTYIGASPQCHIYLFKDPQVGRRHAAVHLLPGGGYEIEDLPLGGRTLVNNKPVTRTRLKSGDAVQIGGTAFLFQERVKSGG